MQTLSIAENDHGSLCCNPGAPGAHAGMRRKHCRIFNS